MHWELRCQKAPHMNKAKIKGFESEELTTKAIKTAAFMYVFRAYLALYEV